MKCYILLFLSVSVTFAFLSSAFFPHAGLYRPTVSSRLTDTEVEAEAALTFFQDWVKDETLSSLCPKSSLYSMAHELLSDDLFWINNELQFRSVWGEYEQKLRSESRQISVIIGAYSNKALAPLLRTFWEGISRLC